MKILSHPPDTRGETLIHHATFYTRRFHAVSEYMYVLSRTRDRYQQEYQMHCEHQRILQMMLTLFTFTRRGGISDLTALGHLAVKPLSHPTDASGETRIRHAGYSGVLCTRIYNWCTSYEAVVWCRLFIILRCFPTEQQIRKKAYQLPGTLCQL